VVALSRLEVLSRKSGVPSSALDAHRGEVFLRLERMGTSPSEILAGPGELAAIHPAPLRVAVCDDGAAAVLAAVWPSAQLIAVPAPVAADALRLGEARLTAGVFADLALLDGHYLRRSDAEIFGAEIFGAEVGTSPQWRFYNVHEALAENVQIRPMTVADVTRVLEIAASLPEAPQWLEAAYLTALNPESSPSRIALVAAEPGPGSVQGFTVASLLPPQAELESIAVAAGSQQRGLGRLLFEALVNDLRAAGVLEIILEVRASNRPALAFYRSAGFGQAGLRRAYYIDPIEDALLMRLHFT